jgi:hypothetical protein
MVLQNWLAEHWFDLIQTLGVVGGLLFTSHALRRDEKARRVSNLIELTRQHRELWMRLLEQSELFRILHPDANLLKKPMTEKEERFVRFLILHLNAFYQAIKADFLDQPAGLRADIKTFFALPIPQAVWKGMKPFCDGDFVEFVETK